MSQPVPVSSETDQKKIASAIEDFLKSPLTHGQESDVLEVLREAPEVFRELFAKFFSGMFDPLLATPEGMEQLKERLEMK